MHECIIHIIKLEHPIKALKRPGYRKEALQKLKLTLKDVDAYAGYLRVRRITGVLAGVQEIRIVNEQNGFGLLRLYGLEFQPTARSLLAEDL